MEISKIASKAQEQSTPIQLNDQLLSYMRRTSMGDLLFVEKKEFFQVEQYIFRIKGVRSPGSYVTPRVISSLTAISNCKYQVTGKQIGNLIVYTFPKENKGILYLGDGIKAFEQINPEPGSLLAYAGENVDGTPVIADFSSADNAHMLVVGCNGSGKTSVLRSLIASMAMKYDREKLQMFIIDHKNSLNKDFRRLPQIVGSAGSSTEDAEKLIEMIIEESERRKGAFGEQEGTSDILSYYNRTGKLFPHIVLLIDEADSLFNSKGGKALLPMVQMLAKEGRSGGIHVIISSQRPVNKNIDVDIVEELSAKIVLKLNRLEDSKRVLMSKDALSLRGKGDMLYMLDGNPPVRAQGAYISGEDLIRVVDSIEKEAKTKS